MHPKGKAELHKRLVDLLRGVVIKEQRRIEFEGGLYEAMAHTAKFIAYEAEEWIHEWDVAPAVWFRVRDELLSTNLADTPGLLRDVATDDQRAALATRIVEWFAALPRPYVTFFRLPLIPDIGAERVVIAPKVSLVRAAENFEEVVFM